MGYQTGANFYGTTSDNFSANGGGGGGGFV